MMWKEILSSGAFLGFCCGVYGFLCVYCGIVVSVLTGNWILAWLAVVTMVSPFACTLYYVMRRREKEMIKALMKPVTVSQEKQEQALKQLTDGLKKEE